MAAKKPTRGRQVMLPPELPPAPLTPWQSSNRRKLVIILLLLLLLAIFLTNKGLLVAAIVDGKPIFRWQLNRVLVSRFGKQTLEGMISEELIAATAKKQGVKVTQAEIDAKTAEIVKGLGGNVNIEDLLRYQGLTKSDFDNQIRLQLTVAKVLGKDFDISDEEVNKYLETNRATLTATEEGELRAQARAAILDQKVSEKLQPWFLELKQKAKILRFL
ncbi:MAG: SurA N-terminal domain-containing protein [Patescibacteria group bacterium]